MIRLGGETQMNISKVRENCVDLIEHMEQNKYSEQYIRILKTEINYNVHIELDTKTKI